ncbi:hypothetical protein ACHAPE_009053 [Trichoderma viride]
MPETVEIAIVSFKDSSPPQSWLDNLKTFASTPGLITLYFGQQIEHPDKYNWVARWTSQSAIDDFHNSPNFKAWADVYAAPLATSVIKTTQQTTGEPSVPLDSPCTEFFINHGASDDFHKERLDPFIQKLVDAKLPGLIGGSTGEYKTVINVNEEVPEQKEVILLLGWVNKEAHTALQGEGGTIVSNLPMILPYSKGFNLVRTNQSNMVKAPREKEIANALYPQYHANLKKL